MQSPPTSGRTSKATALHLLDSLSENARSLLGRLHKWGEWELRSSPLHNELMDAGWLRCSPAPDSGKLRMWHLTDAARKCTDHL